MWPLSVAGATLGRYVFTAVYVRPGQVVNLFLAMALRSVFWGGKKRH